MPYKEYLQTEHWKKTSYECKKRAGFKCKKCKSTENLHAHHLSYENRGDDFEKFDLICLCKECHEKIHKLGE